MSRARTQRPSQASTAGMLSHKSPLIRKNMKPPKPSRFSQLIAREFGATGNVLGATESRTMF